MAQGTHQRRVRRRRRRTPVVFPLLCLLAAHLAQAAGGVNVEIRGVDDTVRDNVLAYLSFERYKKGGSELNADTVERLHNRVEREVDAALKPFGYYEPQVQSTVTQQDNGEWRVLIDITPGQPVIVDHIDVRVDGPGESDPLFRRILRHLPLKSGDVLNHKAYEDMVKNDTCSARDGATTWLPRLRSWCATRCWSTLPPTAPISPSSSTPARATASARPPSARTW